jgi:hypothetical protein
MGISAQMTATQERLRLTTARWVNRRRTVRELDGSPGERWAKVLAHQGSYEQFTYGTDTPSDWLPPLQRCVICSPLSGVIAIDVDDEAEYLTTELARHVSREHAVSTRGAGFHCLIDARMVPPAQWPRQGEIRGANGRHAADIKSCGFIPVPGSEHYSGERYEPVLHDGLTTTIVTATPEIIAAIAAGQQGSGSNGQGNGTGGGHDGELAAAVLGWVRQGLGTEDIYQRWVKIAIPRDPAWPYERKDFERHLDSARRKAAGTPAMEFPPAAVAWAASTASQPAAESTGETARPARINCGRGSGPETIRAVQDALKAGKVPGTYVTHGRVVLLEEVSGTPDATDDGNRPLPVAVSEARAPDLASLLAQHTFTYRLAKAGRGQAAVNVEEEFSPAPAHLTAALAPRSWPGLPPLNGIIGAPVLRPDGSLLTEHGYDQAAGLYLASRVQVPPVPARLSAGDVAWARDLVLRQVLGDFPWAGPADKANYVAALVTQVLRRYLRGAPVPFFVLTATDQGSGKTLLATIPGALCGLVKFTWTDDDEELRKQLTTVMAADQAGVVVFDNLPKGTVIRSAVLAKLLTDRTWGDRLLGGNALGKFANDRLWVATGNNLRVGGDMGTRTVLAALDPGMPHPERRSGFVIPDLESWIEEPANQRALLIAVLVLVADWAAAGCPDAAVVPMRQFTRWARAVGGFLAHHGVSGFLANAAELADMDDDDGDWAALFSRWPAVLGSQPVTSAMVAATEADARWDGYFPTGRGGAALPAKSLGKRLSGERGRYHGGWVLRGQQDRTRLWWWWLESAEYAE